MQNKFEYHPWTANNGKHGKQAFFLFFFFINYYILFVFLLLGLRDVLLQLINVTLKHGSRSTGEPELRQRLYKQLVELIDFVLDGRKSYLDSLKDNEKYSLVTQQFQSQRSDLIYPLGIQNKTIKPKKVFLKLFLFL